MKAVATTIPDVQLLEPKVFEDSRGSFFESYNERVLAELGIMGPFVQDNQSFSHKDVVRGLHYQIKQPQGKLIRCLSGEIYDVAVDLRRNSPTFCKWVGETLTAANRKMLWIPPGFAHGFKVLSDGAEVLYKATNFGLLNMNEPYCGMTRPFRLNGRTKTGQSSPPKILPD